MCWPSKDGWVSGVKKINRAFETISSGSETTILTLLPHYFIPLLFLVLEFDVIHYLEKSFGVGQMTNQTDSGSIVQHQSTNQGSKVSSWSSTPPEVSSSESSASGNVNENPIAGTLSDDS
ncbi:hypothetical protein HPP92_000449 [Vanilla planifolia]|uniref:Uncharacterized protein n=1 Tax=Vanilla planifolia TaxID=51239 RepID=A0A835VIR5_VANPL|nr:hypothetical protein HPP92_000449 [Vanilla planifolia]